MSAADEAWQEWIGTLEAKRRDRGRVDFLAGYRRALEDAADHMPAFHDRDVPEWAITSACKWLRARAAAVVPRETKD